MQSNILCPASPEKNQPRWVRWVSNTFLRTWKVWGTVSPWWKATYLEVAHHWHGLRCRRRNLHLPVGFPTSPFKYHTKVLLAMCHNKTWEYWSWRDKWLEANLSQGAYPNSTKLSPKEELTLEAYCFRELAKKEIFPSWSWCLENQAF